MKTTLGTSRANNLLSGVDKNVVKPLENTIITTPQQIAVMQTEKRTARMQGMVTPTEKQDFLANFGRERESDILREFVLFSTGKPTNKLELRALILNLIKNNNK